MPGMYLSLCPKGHYSWMGPKTRVTEKSPVLRIQPITQRVNEPFFLPPSPSPMLAPTRRVGIWLSATVSGLKSHVEKVEKAIYK